ncbi:MAG: polyketide synthase dehydratase domain-containing protein, partial [Deltaproteobacteria bacterium]|nr:polyketide synthase dehydratase domain-containing protein [Deltaproteobacteria bacterium]
ARGLRAGELDLALVGAADFSCEPVHEAALRALGDPRAPGDAALVLVLQRAEDARREGRPILALLDEGESDESPKFDTDAVEARFGRAHAAMGLVQMAAAALACARGQRVGGEAWRGVRRTRVAIEALGGQEVILGLRSENEAIVMQHPERDSSRALSQEYPAHREPVRLPALPEDDAVQCEWRTLRACAPSGPQVMPPAPVLPPVLEDAPTSPAETRADGATVVRAASVSDRALPLSLQASEWIAAQQKRLARVHREFVERQTEAQRQFLEMREGAAQQLIERARSGMAPRPGEAGGAYPALDANVKDGKAGKALTPALSHRSFHSRGEGAAVATSLEAIPCPADFVDLPGLKLDRRGLEIHASGRISEIYGPLFAKQDGFQRRVRMPEPPLLLADRLVGLEAEAGSMGKGRLWTETDVTPDAWYLHDGRMPAGILIEAGQADLMLISYLGVDFLNQGERVYRLLGCDLTYRSSLPAAGETLRYEIQVEGHANQGEVRLFFFRYDCATAAGREPRLSVRNGQAGFFTDQELADSAGVLWEAESAERKANPRLDAPARKCSRTRLDRSQLEAFAKGDVPTCFGEGFELGATHTRTPRIAGGTMLLLEEVTELTASGGPWGRGYLRAVDHLSPEDWFFQGHFKNDPCMPGTLMFEGCLQAMAVYLASFGYTLDKDGWRFEPVPDETYRLRCRGQATPASREVVYEVFVEEIEAGPTPTLWADLLVSVDGLKAFHCRRMGLRLVPGWPLDSLPEARELSDSRPVAAAKGFSFGARSLLACAWGKPSEAFGEMYQVFDGPRRVPRLPGPPYLFMTRVSRIEGGEIGAMQLGTTVEAEYDIPPDAWYFGASGARTMPFCVLLEAALQPCGWLASYVGSALGTERDLAFRNLDGTGTLLAEIPPDAGTLVTRSKLTQISRSAGMIIESFDVTCSIGGRSVYELKTVFGFFPREALEAQVGLPAKDGEHEALTAPSEETIDLRARPERYFGSGARLGAESLRMLDRVTGIWPTGGEAKLGRFRAELDVDPSAWFFKAHFFQDPVQPGSLGLEAMVQLLQFAMIRLGHAEGATRFEPLALGAPLDWKYRGQVVPKNERMVVLLDLVCTSEDAAGRVAVANASLWVDGKRIYEARGMAMRAGGHGGPPPPQAGGRRDLAHSTRVNEETLSPGTHRWLNDHRPTWTVPALPMMAMVDRLAAAALGEGAGRVVAIKDAQVLRWLPITGPTRLAARAEQGEGGEYQCTLLAWREASKAELSRFEPVATARVVVADTYREPSEAAWTAPADARPVANPYESGELFHGPSFQLLRSLARGNTGSTATLDAGVAGAPAALLDALTHGIPHDALNLWSSEIAEDLVAYPTRIRELTFHEELPREGPVRLETRFAGFADGPRQPCFKIQAIASDRVIATLELVETLFPKGPIGSAPPRERRAFLRDRAYVPGVRLSREEEGSTRLSAEEVAASDWLPGTLAQAYQTTSQDHVGEIAAREHVAAQAQVHPSSVHVSKDLSTARCDTEPLAAWSLECKREGARAIVRGAPQLDLAPVRE